MAKRQPDVKRSRQQVTALAKIDALREAILNLPADASINCPIEDVTLFITDPKVFVDEFRGFEAERDAHGTDWIVWNGITYAATGPTWFKGRTKIVVGSQ